MGQQKALCLAELGPKSVTRGTVSSWDVVSSPEPSRMERLPMELCNPEGAGNLQVLSALCKGDGSHLTAKQTAPCGFIFDDALSNNSTAKGSNIAIRLPFPKTPNSIYHVIKILPAMLPILAVLTISELNAAIKTRSEMHLKPFDPVLLF